MPVLTARQAEILAFIESALQHTGRPPTRAEIARHFGFRSANAAEEHLQALARKGVLRLDGGTARGISLVAGQVERPEREAAPSARLLPLIGQVSAGVPILAEAHIEDRLAVDPAMFRPRADFLLRVRGSSMLDAGILDGDLLAVHSTASVSNGQIAVVRIEDEVTVKRFEQHGRQVVLQPANPEFKPGVFDAATDQLAIEGLVVGVLRLGIVGRVR